jgi:hypothetical protein
VFSHCFIKFSLQKLSKGSGVGANVDNHGTDVAPLSVPELLESLVRQSEPLLDHLGIKRGMRSRFVYETAACCSFTAWSFFFSWVYISMFCGAEMC